MKNKKTMFLLGLGYTLGLTVASLYTSKKGEEVSQEIKKGQDNGESKFKIILRNIVKIHENCFEDLRESVMTEENIAKFNEKKEELLDLIDDYKEQGEELILELREKGIDYKDTAMEKLEELYKEKKVDIEEIIGKTPEKAEELKGKLLTYFNELKSKMKK